MDFKEDFSESEEYGKYSAQINRYFQELSHFTGIEEEKTFSLFPKAKILTMLWKILEKIFHNVNPEIIDERKLDLRFYSVEVTEKLNECIKTYIRNRYSERGIVFSDYLVKMEIKNIFRLYKSGHQRTDSTGFSNFNRKKIFQVKRYYEEALECGLSEKSALERVASLFSITAEKAEEYLEQSRVTAVSNDFTKPDDSGKSRPILDSCVLQVSGKSEIEERFFARYDFDVFLEQVEFVFRNEVKAEDQKLVSKLLTVFFLKPFTEPDSNQNEGNPLTLYGSTKPVMDFDWAEADRKYSFLNENMIQDFPKKVFSFSEIAEENSISKMNARAKLNRVLDKAKERFLVFQQ